MLTFVLDAIENYASAHTSCESQVLYDLSMETLVKYKLPHWSIGHIEGAFLRFLVRVIKAKRVLEIGTFTGYSALAMAEGLPEDGELITLDVDPKVTDTGRLFWDKSPHGKKIKLVTGTAEELLKTIDGPFDFVFIDADKVNYINYWEECVPKVRSGGCITVDNVLWRGRVLNPKDDDSFTLDAFNKHVLSDDRVEVVMLTIRDGLTLAYKR